MDPQTGKAHRSLLGALVFAVAVAITLVFILQSAERPRDMRLPEPEPRPVLLDTPPMAQLPAPAQGPAARD